MSAPANAGDASAGDGAVVRYETAGHVAAMDAVFGSADALEGATAFAEKRPPAWTGR